MNFHNNPHMIKCMLFCTNIVIFQQELICKEGGDNRRHIFSMDDLNNEKEADNKTRDEGFNQNRKCHYYWTFIWCRIRWKQKRRIKGDNEWIKILRAYCHSFGCFFDPVGMVIVLGGFCLLWGREWNRAKRSRENCDKIYLWKSITLWDLWKIISLLWYSSEFNIFKSKDENNNWVVNCISKSK